MIYSFKTSQLFFVRLAELLKIKLYNLVLQASQSAVWLIVDGQSDKTKQSI